MTDITVSDVKGYNIGTGRGIAIAYRHPLEGYWAAVRHPPPQEDFLGGMKQSGGIDPQVGWSKLAKLGDRKSCWNTLKFWIS